MMKLQEQENAKRANEAEEQKQQEAKERNAKEAAAQKTQNAAELILQIAKDGSMREISSEMEQVTKLMNALNISSEEATAILKLRDLQKETASDLSAAETAAIDAANAARRQEIEKLEKRFQDAQSSYKAAKKNKELLEAKQAELEQKISQSSGTEFGDTSLERWGGRGRGICTLFLGCFWSGQKALQEMTHQVRQCCKLHAFMHVSWKLLLAFMEPCAHVHA